MAEIKPCPFCGGEARAVCFCDPLFDRYNYIVECRECKASTRNFDGISFNPEDDEQKAIEAWNRRADNNA